MYSFSGRVDRIELVYGDDDDSDLEEGEIMG